jgi:hypothetical protein
MSHGYRIQGGRRRPHQYKIVRRYSCERQATLDNFMSEVLRRMDSEFQKGTIQKLATFMAKSIATLEYGFNQGAPDIPLPSDEDSDLEEIDRDKF